MLLRRLVVLLFLSLSVPAWAAEAVPAMAAPAMVPDKVPAMAPDMAPPVAPAAMLPAAMTAPPVVSMAAVLVVTKKPALAEPMALVAPMEPVKAVVPVEPQVSDSPPYDPQDDPALREPQQSSSASPLVKVQDATKLPTPVSQPVVKAATVKQDPWWKGLLGGLLRLVILFLGAVATGLGALLIKWVTSKIKLSDAQVQSELEKLYDKAVALGVDFAEQQAKKLGDNTDTKGKRLEWAIEQVQNVIKDLGLAEKTADWVRTHIEAKLGEQNRSKTSVSPP
jgi:hypothetical protein